MSSSFSHNKAYSLPRKTSRLIIETKKFFQRCKADLETTIRYGNVCKLFSMPMSKRGVNILFGSNTFTGRNRPYNHTANGEFCKKSLYQIGRNKWPFAFFSNNFLRVLTCGFFRRLALPRAARLIWRSNFTALHNAKKVSFLNASHIISFQLQYQWQSSYTLVELKWTEFL